MAGDGSPAPHSLDQTLPFNIPSQPLEDAIYAFGAITGLQVVVDGEAVAGRRSTEVKGDLTAVDGLRVLLTGTGLAGRLLGDRAVVLFIVEQRDPGEFQRYSAALQEAALRQLCSDPDTRLGTYRIATRLWLSDLGGVKRLELLSSTGDAVRDARIRDLLARITVASPPPALPQPVVMVILPRPPEDSGDCRAR